MNNKQEQIEKRLKERRKIHEREELFAINFKITKRINIIFSGNWKFSSKLKIKDFIPCLFLYKDLCKHYNYLHLGITFHFLKFYILFGIEIQPFYKNKEE